MASFYEWGSTASRLQSSYEEAVYFLPLSSQIFLVLIWSTWERWKTESTLEPPSGFWYGTSRLEIQHLGNPAPIHMTEPLRFIKNWQISTDGKTKLTLFLTMQYWSPRYEVSVLSICGGFHPEEFIVASFYIS